MAYYMGDYYRGDYYRGDPAFGFLGKLIGGVAQVAGGLLPGPLGSAVGKVGAVIAGPSAPKPALPSMPVLKAPTGLQALPAIAQKLTRAAVGIPIGVARGAAQAIYEQQPVFGQGGIYHYNQQYTKAGQPRRIKKNGQPYKIPRMNPANPRALRRAIRRAHGFAKLARHCLNFVSPRPVRGRAHFKRKRR